MQRFISLWWSSKTCVTATWGPHSESKVLGWPTTQPLLGPNFRQRSVGCPGGPKYRPSVLRTQDLRAQERTESGDPHSTGSPVGELARFPLQPGKSNLASLIASSSLYNQAASSLWPCPVQPFRPSTDQSHIRRKPRSKKRNHIPRPRLLPLPRPHNSSQLTASGPCPEAHTPSNTQPSGISLATFNTVKLASSSNQSAFTMMPAQRPSQLPPCPGPPPSRPLPPLPK